MKNILLVHLYPVEMNIYGDNGNVQIVAQKLKWLGYSPKIVGVGVGDKIPSDAAMIFGGGGQDAGQNIIATDLLNKKKQLLSMSDDGVSMLMVCGLYQLFGQYFQTADNKKIAGIGLFNLYTVASNDRIIGNIVSQTSQWGELVGYENHSGRTYLGSGTNKLGTTKINQGNNGQDLSEGCKQNNVFGTYLHGPILSKNTQLTNYFIEQITGQKISSSLSEKVNLADNLAQKAHEVAKKLGR